MRDIMLGAVMMLAAMVLAVVLTVLCTAGHCYAAEGYDQVATGSDYSAQSEVVSYGMVPVYGRDIEDGDYEVRTESSSTFFRIEHAVLHKTGDDMTADITLSSSYEYLYIGKAADAAAAPLEDYIAPEIDDDGCIFTIPVESLNSGIECAAFSKKKKQWYDRDIMIDASSLPPDALRIELPDYQRIGDAIALYDQENGTDTAEEMRDAHDSHADEYYSADEDEADREQREAAMRVLVMAVIIIAAGGALNFAVKRRKKQ